MFALTAVERRRAADMFAGLSDEQWAAASLCAEWTVRDVAGHLIGPFCVSVPRFMLGSLVSGGPSRYSVKRSRQLGRRPAGEIVAILRGRLSSPRFRRTPRLAWATGRVPGWPGPGVPVAGSLVPRAGDEFS